MSMINKMKLLKIILPLFIIFSANNTSAQYSESHIGIRGGINGGIYYQNLMSAGTAETAFFAMLSVNKNSVRATIMKLTYETSLSEITENLFFIWGYGGHAGFSVTDHTYFFGRKYMFEYERFRPLAGIDAWTGVEYRFTGIPMAIGLNIKPQLEIMVPGFINFQIGDIGLSFAYTF